MSTKNKNQGFAILEILLAAVTLFFIIAISWVVIHHQKTAKTASKPKADLSKYLEIKEWQVYLQLPDTSSKAAYKPANPDDKNNIVVSSNDLDKFASEHKECSTANEFNIITRIKEGEGANGTPAAETKARMDKQAADGKAKKLGFYYYYSSRSSVAPCFGTNIGDVQKLTSDVYDLWDKLPTYNNVVINPQ
jgi:hypothetical protein